MREILFRGKRFCNNEWVEGFLIKDREFYGKPEHHSYIVNHQHPSGCFGGDIYLEVIPETVGQYTGLTDKNGKQIFEGDVFLHNNKYPYEVIWNDEQKGFYASGIDFLDDDCMGNFYEINIEVIGNIHDNPELIQGVE